MSTEKEKIDTVAALDATDPAGNPYLADALERIERLRTVLEGFPKSPGKRLTPGQLRSARRITVDALQQAERFAVEQPNIAGALADVGKMRDTAHFLLAYEGLREKSILHLRALDQFILQRKYDASRYALGLYRVIKTYAANEPDSDQMQGQVDIMQPLFGRPRRSKPALPADPDASAVKK